MAIIVGNANDNTLTGTPLDDEINGREGNDVLYGLDGSDLLNGSSDYDFLYGGKGDDTYLLLSTANAQFASIRQFFYDRVIENANEGYDKIIIAPGDKQTLSLITNDYTYYTRIDIPDFVEELIIFQGLGATMDVYGNDQDNSIYGTRYREYLFGGNGNDFIAGSGRDSWDITEIADGDTIDGGEGYDVVSYSNLGVSFDKYTITPNADGSYTANNAANKSDILKNIETVVFIDGRFSVILNSDFSSLFRDNLSQSKAISSIYQILSGGVPSIAGYDFLIKGNLASNFGAATGTVFNEENIFINVANALVQGNAAAAAKFNTLASGTTVEAKIASLYTKIIPAGKQTIEGLAFITRPDGINFYKDVALQRGITSENGPAIVALASLLKIAVDGKIGVGNAISDLILSIANGSSTLPATSTAVVPIETTDGSKYDADDAPDVAATSPPPLALIGVVADEALVFA
jgi:hypothetical protein